jgi:hypothetical protein
LSVLYEGRGIHLSAPAGKSLKEQNRWQLWLILAANVVAFYFVLQSDVLSTAGLKGIFATVSNLLPIGLAIVVTTVLNGVLKSSVKDRLVFLRWKDALPGHRAFSEYGPADPRIDMAALKKLNAVEMAHQLKMMLEEEVAARGDHRTVPKIGAVGRSGPAEPSARESLFRLPAKKLFISS